jgi:hypothetical protein
MFNNNFIENSALTKLHAKLRLALFPGGGAPAISDILPGLQGDLWGVRTR